MDVLYQQNVDKLSSKCPKTKLVGSKRAHEDSDEDSLGDSQKDG